MTSQYRPEYQVGQIAANGTVKHDAINRAPRAAVDAARPTGVAFQNTALPEQ